MKAFDPPFNNASPRSQWPPQGGLDQRSKMQSAERIGFKFKKDPPPHTHKSLWDASKTMFDGKYSWDEIPNEWVITRVSLREKRNQTHHERVHFASYPRQRGEWTTVGAHRKRNEAAGMSWERIKGNLHWDSTYNDAEGPIITITPPK